MEEEGIDPSVMGSLNGQPQQPAPQPQAQPKQQAQQSFGPLGKAMQTYLMDTYVIGATGGDVVRSGLEASYNSYAGIMEGVMGKNIPAARQERTQWKEAAEGTLAFNKSRIEEYSKIWSGDGPMEDKLAQLNEISMGHYQDRIMGGLAQEQNITAIGRFLDMLTEQQQKAEAATMQLEKQFAQIEAKVPGGNPPMQ